MMNKYLSAILLVILSIQVSISQDLTFEAYNPKSTLVVPGDSILKARFPFIDVHGHQYRMPEQDLAPVVAAMDTLNMAIMVNLSGRSGDELVKSLNNVKTNFPGRFVLFCNINFEGAGAEGWIEEKVKQLREDVKQGAVGLKVYKSLGLRNKDFEGKRLAIDDPRLDPIWATCGELGIPV
ncbi:MAG: amidohydrolase, partial [Flavobacteriaceae bacterium]|nr:amidohydrolase [Flavobacteriaceae bacterium]